MYETKDGYIISEEQYKEIKQICPQLSHEEILRLVDLFKAGLIVF